MADITITEPTGWGLASVLPMRGQAFRPEAPTGVTLLPTGPEQWLAVLPGAAPGWITALAEDLAGIANVIDQSAAYLPFVIGGADGRRLVQKGLAIDISPAAFPCGAVVVSAIGHIGVVAHHAASDRFHLLAPRSYAASFRHWLDAARASW